MQDDILVNPNQDGAIDAICNPGDTVMSGSCEQGTPGIALAMLQDRPYIGGSPGVWSMSWKCAAHNFNGAGVTLRAWAVCHIAP